MVTYITYHISLHDALPISVVILTVVDEQSARDAVIENRVAEDGENGVAVWIVRVDLPPNDLAAAEVLKRRHPRRSEEHTSELQSPCNLVCRLLLVKKNIY